MSEFHMSWSHVRVVRSNECKLWTETDSRLSGEGQYCACWFTVFVRHMVLSFSFFIVCWVKGKCCFCDVECVTPNIRKESGGQETQIAAKKNQGLCYCFLESTQRASNRTNCRNSKSPHKIKWNKILPQCFRCFPNLPIGGSNSIMLFKFFAFLLVWTFIIHSFLVNPQPSFNFKPTK